ncbi:hypothetical protein L1987_49985 [Smallanthus sonchifolius]|uniref:Uncharacterized protein n=1 Tax=Smallanthus sonchifolius TaxID=185202 RepID=A0ACB9FW03_9ASTR|nr:hypothetical protein L1987_49985 [Smallanthus sonchifolius]
METSLPYGGDSTALRVNTNRKPPIARSAGDASALRIHAKQKFHIDSNTRLQFIIVICVVPFCEIAIATQNLKNANLTREDGFGSVYKAD